MDWWYRPLHPVSGENPRRGDRVDSHSSHQLGVWSEPQRRPSDSQHPQPLAQRSFILLIRNSSVIPGGDVSAAALEYLESSTTSSSYTWTVNLVGGTYVTIKVTDSTGSNVYSAPLTIQSGSSTSCMTTTGGSSSTEVSSVCAR